MTLHIVPVSAGEASLGSWGTIALTGAESAVLQLICSEDIELPAAVVTDITGGVILLNDEVGRLLYLPYAGELVVSYDLAQGDEAYAPIVLRRDPDHGMRTAEVRIVPGSGAVHLTETTLMRFTDHCDLAWKRDENFAGWSIEGITSDEIHLMTGDWSGHEERQIRSLTNGDPSQ